MTRTDSHSARGIRLSKEEAWERLAGAHTGILTTLRRDGWPVSLPTWFVAVEPRIYVRTVRDSAKVGRVRRDPRAAFLVEAGRAWQDLTAVMLYVEAELLPDGSEAAAAASAIDEKYAAFRVPEERLPPMARRHYAERDIVRLTPSGRMLTWDNARVPLRS